MRRSDLSNYDLPPEAGFKGNLTFMQMVHFIPSSQRRLALLAAQADTAPALICGGAGTGKGAIAQWVHANGPRAAKALVTATHTEPLAAQIHRAQGGTLIVPEIGE